MVVVDILYCFGIELVGGLVLVWFGLYVCILVDVGYVGGEVVDVVGIYV